MAGASVPGSPSHEGVVREPPSNDVFNREGEAADRRTRERAYFLWEQEGRPEGRADEHWHAARRHLRREEP
jgi:hypothetical protein